MTTTTALDAIRFGLDVTLKATILFALALLLAVAIPRLSAAARHLLAILGLAGALALPLTAPLVPSVSVPLLPSLVAVPAEAGPEALRPAGVENRMGEESSSPAARRAADAPEVPPAAGAISPFATLSSQRAATSPQRGSGPAAWAPWALLLWAVGAAFSLARLAVGSLRVRAIVRAAVPLADRDWSFAAADLSGRLGLRRRVRLLSSAEVPVAMTAGIRRPVLLLHENARKWPADRRRVVLLHELAHVRRSDWLTFLVAELAAAVYWFHPLVWLARREARWSGERACDDLVLDSGTKPSVYAAHLLGIVRTFAPGARAGLPVLAMAARPSQFEGRMRAILNPGLHRRGPSRGQVRAAALGLFGSVLFLAALQPWAPQCAEGAAAATGSVASSEFPGGGAARPDSERPPETAFPGRAPGFRRSSTPAEEKLSDDARPTDTPEDALPDDSFSKAVTREIEQPKTPGFVLASDGNSKSGSGWYSRAMKLHRDEQYDEAIRAFEKAIEAGYREDASSYNIACGYALKGDRDRAFEWLRKAEEAGFRTDKYLSSDDDLDNLRSDPRFKAFRQEARQHRNEDARGEARQAARRYEQLAARKAESGEAYFGVGRQLLKTGEYALAAKAYRQSAELGHQPGTSLYNAACALALGGEKAAAFESLQKALENGFDDPEIFRKDDDLDSIRGEPRFAQIQALADELAMPSLGWGAKFLRSSERADWRKAAQHAREVAAKHPGLGRVWFTLGYVELKAERPEAAAEAFQKALQLGYRKPTTLYNLACSYARADQKDRAFDFLFQALDAGFEANGNLRKDEDLDNLRGDPRFRKAQKLVDARIAARED
ncbi:MAG TPA: M56 family metallopeptidase [Thermoanaerobaculia bacterium]|nr:M56 family metallopeptidase [Thermoanaerobaculia bacterium]